MWYARRYPVAQRSAAQRGPSALTLVAIAHLLGCGGEPTAPPPDDQGSPGILSFAAIAGQWIGTVEEQVLDRTITYQAKLEFGEGAAQGVKVGTIAYFAVDDPADPDRTMDCGGDLLAQKANGSAYEVSERLTYGTDQCRNGLVLLQHDPDAGTLTYEWYTTAGELKATATLTN